MAVDRQALARLSGQRLAAAAELLALASACSARASREPLQRAIAAELACALQWHLLSVLPEPSRWSEQTTLVELCDYYVSAEANAHDAVVVELQQLAGADSWLVELARAGYQAYQYLLPAAQASDATVDRLVVVNLTGKQWLQPVDWSVAAAQRWYDGSAEMITRHREQAVEC